MCASRRRYVLLGLHVVCENWKTLQNGAHVVCKGSSSYFCREVSWLDLASFPGLPCLFFGWYSVQYMEVEDCEKRGRPGLIHHVSGRKVDVGGRGQYSNM